MRAEAGVARLHRFHRGFERSDGGRAFQFGHHEEVGPGGQVHEPEAVLHGAEGSAEMGQGSLSSPAAVNRAVK